jgi:hypothetical protein
MKISPSFVRKSLSVGVFALSFCIPLIAAAATFKDPLGGLTVAGLVNKLLEIIVRVAAVLAVFFLIFAGFKFVTSSGDPGKIKQAKEQLMYTIIGGLIALGAFVISSVIKNTVCSVAPAAC